MIPEVAAVPDVPDACSVPDVAAVVVNYNAATHLGSCLRSLAAAGVGERIVVDNASVDGSRAVAAAADPDARWIDSGANIGYGRAANLGVAATSSGFVLVCNPDLEVAKDAVAALLARLRVNGSLGLVGPKVLNPDGSIYPSARTFPDLVDAIGHGLLGLVVADNRFTRRYRRLDGDHSAATGVDWVSGACFLARRRAWDAIGGFDPDYFMYLEDVDLCWRAHHAGWGVGFEPAASVVHIQGVSANKHPYRMLVAHHRSLWRFASRTTTGQRRLALPLVGVGLVGRLGVAAVHHRLGGTGAAHAIGPGAPSRVP